MLGGEELLHLLDEVGVGQEGLHGLGVEAGGQVDVGRGSAGRAASGVDPGENALFEKRDHLDV